MEASSQLGQRSEPPKEDKSSLIIYKNVTLWQQTSQSADLSGGRQQGVLGTEILVYLKFGKVFCNISKNSEK